MKFIPELHIITFHTNGNPPESIYQDLADERIEFHAIYRGIGDATLSGFYQLLTRQAIEFASKTRPQLSK